MEKTVNNFAMDYKEIVSDDLFEMSLFLNRVFCTEKFSSDYLSQLYFSERQAIGYNVFVNGKIVAHYCVVKRTYFFRDKKYTLGWSVNTAVDSNYRGRGFFEDLATRTYSLAKKMGIEIILGVANRASTKLFLNKLGFCDLGEIRWNIDIFARYNPRVIFPDSLKHNRALLLSFFGNIYFLKLPFLKLYSINQFSFFSCYLTSRRPVYRIGFTLPQHWFKSNWNVIAYNLFSVDELNYNYCNEFIAQFSMDILESDTF
jgi:hypothetical protein